ncbi:fatty acid synthase [Anabrus simplex]|uniref:fatty acid synthase n=1 Tax=Anabrus simplex TaxID=316456 RepID=UPI0035A39F7A
MSVSMREGEESLRFGQFLASPPPGEEVVISGMAGYFPECDNMYELRDKLFNHVDMITGDDRRWKNEYPNIPYRSGKIKKLAKFDSSFFGYHYKEAQTMCPMLRCLLERTYEAIIDAGIHPASLKGTRTGVYIGTCFSETEKAWFFGNNEQSGYPVSCSARSLFCSRITHWLGVTGPSYTTDSACSSSLFAMNQAYEDFRLGVIDYAIVGGSNLCLDPYTTQQFASLGVLCQDGRVKSFDEAADGYARSEAAVIAFLQRAKGAKRIYCTIIHSKLNCDGYKPEGITFPATKLHEALFQEFYKECNINPASIDYMEAHATGTRVGDPEELSAIERVFCKNRNIPLPVGASKSNFGHSEPASGLCALGKVIIAMETGIIAANLNFKTPREAVQGFKNGKFKVIAENTPLTGKLVALNSFGFGGANAHLLLRRNTKEKVNGGAPEDPLPRLVAVSARMKEGVDTILHDVESRPVDAEFVSLLHDLHVENTPGHFYRGYTLLTSGEKKIRDIQYYDQVQRPLWLVFSGFGNQWVGIGRSLLLIPKFAATIQQCDEALRPNGINIQKIIASEEPKEIQDLVNTSVALVAIQLGLVDVLSCVGINAEGMLGHTTGELVCAYADGCLTAQQAILVVYHHALILSNSSNQDLLKYLQQNISNPKPRSRQWVSSSVPENERNNSRAKLASPEYFYNCLLGCSLFEDAFQQVPDNALVIELSPENDLQSLLHKPSRRNIKVFSLTPTSGHSGIEQLFIMLGQLYEAGVQLQLSKLYPPVQYPVSRGTPMLSPLVRWEHSRNWPLYNKHEADQSKMSERLVPIRVTDHVSEFYKGHVIDGRNLYPATGYLVLAWETFSGMFGSKLLISVVFEDVCFLRATNLPPEGKVEFIVSVQKHSGQFEVAEGGSAIVTGRIKKLDHDSQKFLNVPLPKPGQGGSDHIDLNARDIYKELRLRGYSYSGVFRGLVSSNLEASRGVIRWNENWVGFMDTMLQMRILSRDTRLLYVPTGIERLVIDVDKHITELERCKEENLLPVYAWDNIDTVRAGGVEIQSLNASWIARRKVLGEPVLERYQFIPHTDLSEPTLNLEQTIRMCVHIVLENHLGIKVRALELAPSKSEEDTKLLANYLVNILGDLPLIQAEVIVLAEKESNQLSNLDPGVQVLSQQKFPADHSALLVVGTDIIQDSKALRNAIETLADDGCILARERHSVDLRAIEQNLHVVVNRIVGKERFLLLKQKKPEMVSPVVINITEKNLLWLPTLQTALRDIKPPQRVVLVAQGEPLSGILGLFNCVRKEFGGELTRCFFILDPEAPQFRPSLPLYSKQLEKDLAVNVLQNGHWGSYRHLLLEPPSKVTAPHGYSTVLVRGDLSSLTWVEGPLSNYNEMSCPVHIYYSALNFRDVMLNTGKLGPDTCTRERIKMNIEQGFEFSGRDPSGRRVMGLIMAGTTANIIDSCPELTWDVPDTWTLEDAATVPVVYATIIYALKVEGRLEPGETVLIHAGSGGVGQAAINYCLFHGCTVYTTVGTQEKRDFIKKQFPQITDDYIGNSRDSTFEEFILQRTNGRGVDMVLNSLADEKLYASIRCLAKGGRFLEIGKFDITKNSPLAMDIFTKDQSFHAIMLDMFFNASSEEKMFLYELLQEALNEGSVKPLVRTVFDMNSVEQAFRYMAAGKHVGKVLIQIRPQEDELWAKPTLMPMEVMPKFHCSSNCTYIILGGLGGFGLELTDWLVLRGARKVVLTSRRGISTGYQSLRVRAWRSYGVSVAVSTVDVSTEEGATKLLKDANAIGPVEGIFNLAVVLRDALLENQTEETFQESLRSKAIATRHLDALSRKLCPQLKQFVVFSSVSCGRGNAGQTNYGMSNSIMERVCEARARDGLPALAIQWGAVGEVGLVAEMQEDHQELVIGGTLQQRISSCLEVMDVFLKQPHPVVASMVVAEKRAAGGKFGSIVECVANILGLRDLKSVSGIATLTELGMDSMMAVEIKQAIEREYEVFLTPQEIRNLTIKQLQELAAADGTQDASGAKKDEQIPDGAEKAKKLQFIFNFYGNKETGSQILLPLLSLNSRRTASPLFMIPGMEGTATTLEYLSKNLTPSCVGLQLCCHNTSTTVPGMAAHLLQHIRKQLVPGKPFTFLGHSFGGLVALEMAAALEAEGWLGHVFLLDASPEFTSELVKQHLVKDASDEDSFQIALLYRIIQFITPTFEYTIQQFASSLKNLSSWSERVEWVLNMAPEVDRDYQRAVVNAIFTNIRAIMNYSWPKGRRLQSAVTLIRPTNTLVKMEGDCGLSKICQKDVAVHFVDGDHTSILQNAATADIINQTLED